MQACRSKPCFELDTDRTVYGLMKAASENGVFSGGVLLVAVAGKIVFHAACGVTDIGSDEQVDLNTVFDLASLTKPLATSLAVMTLLDQGRLGLDWRLAGLLAPLARDPKADITIAQLLAHSSGLPDYRPYFEKLRSGPFVNRRAALRQMLAREELVTVPGSAVCYSDPGFMLLAWAIEEAAGQRLDRLVAQEIYRPLGIEDDLFFVDLSGPFVRRKFAATEHCPWRKMILKGQVHDDNAYVAGGIEGHAGLFGTAWAVWKLLDAMAACYRLKFAADPFLPSLVELFFAEQPGGRSLGFDRVSFGGVSAAGRYFSPHTVGHLGFTGTSFWVDLEQDIIVVLLTNRINPSRDNLKIRLFRPELHDAVMGLARAMAREAVRVQNDSAE